MFTLIVMKKDSTDFTPKTVHLSYGVIFLMCLFFFGLPVAAYMLVYKVIAPKLYQADIINITESKKTLFTKLTNTEKELKSLKVDYKKIKDILDTERKQRAESEARATIAETAQTATGQQMASTEEQLLSLKRKVAAYEKLLKPDTKQELLQCFNISAKYNNGKVTYAVSFLKNNPKDHHSISVKADIRVLRGSSALSLQGAADKPLATRSFGLSKDYRLSGRVTTKVDPNQLHILDIRVRDSNNKQIAKCWKAL